MKLMTKAIEQAARKQYKLGANIGKQKVVAKFFDPTGSWTWYLMNQDPNDHDYLWGIVDGFEVEMGSFSLRELESVKGMMGLGIERDRWFKPVDVKVIWDMLNKKREG